MSITDQLAQNPVRGQGKDLISSTAKSLLASDRGRRAPAGVARGVGVASVTYRTVAVLRSIAIFRAFTRPSATPRCPALVGLDVDPLDPLELVDVPGEHGRVRALGGGRRDQDVD